MYLFYKAMPSPQGNKTEIGNFISNIRTVKISVTLGELQCGGRK